MRPVDDDFLLSMAGVSASLLGLFLLGVLFYTEAGLRRLGSEKSALELYMRAGIRITLVALSIPLIVSLALVALEPVWARAILLVSSFLLVASNISTVALIRPAWKETRSLVWLAHEAISTALAGTLVVLPWALGGLRPTREDITWAILLAFAVGFLSITATVMSAYDVARSEALLVDNSGSNDVS